MRDERLLDAIYASTFDDGALQHALSGLAQACHSRCAGVFRLSECGLDWERAHGMPSGFMARFAQHTPHDPRVAYALAQPLRTLLDDYTPQMRKAMHASGTERLARRWDLPWTLAMLCARETDGAWALYLSHSSREGQADTAHRDCFAHYAPHFARALQLRSDARRRMRAWRCARDDENACIARLTIDANARVISMDDDAHAMLGAAEGGSICRGVLTLASPGATARLHDLTAHLASQPRVGPVAATFELPQRQPSGSLCLRLDTSTRHWRNHKRLLSLWLERRTTRAAPISRAGKAPTPRQIEVLQCLERGLTTARIAGELGIGDATVRTHIKHLLALTDSHNRRACLAQARRRGWL